MSGFLNRWSKRKTDARRDEDQPDPERASPLAADDADGDQPKLLAHPQPDETEIAAQIAALPSLDEITAGTDIRPFLQDFVPRALKNAAMRRAWVSDPIISTHLDVARDYAWEFNAGPLPVGFSTGLGADAVQRGLDALNIAPPPERATEAPSPAQDATASDTAPNIGPDDGAGDIAPQERQIAPDLTANTTLASAPSPASASDPAASSEPAAPAPMGKSGIRLGLKRHGGALPD